MTSPTLHLKDKEENVLQITVYSFRFDLDGVGKEVNKTRNLIMGQFKRNMSLA